MSFSCAGCSLLLLPQQPPILFADLSPTTCPASRGAEIAFSAPSISDLNMSAPSTNNSEAVQRGRGEKHKQKINKKVNGIWAPVIYGVGRRWQCTCGMTFCNNTEGNLGKAKTAHVRDTQPLFLPLNPVFIPVIPQSGSLLGMSNLPSVGKIRPRFPHRALFLSHHTWCSWLSALSFTANAGLLQLHTCHMLPVVLSSGSLQLKWVGAKHLHQKSVFFFQSYY